MYGAILGDIAGSVYEFDGITRSVNDLCRQVKRPITTFTDDTVMTIAFADAIMTIKDSTDVAALKQVVISKMKYWGNKYLNAGYGQQFYLWLLRDDPKPYASYANGAAMRISPV